MARKPSHPESQLQIQCVSWFKYQYPHLAPLFFAVPNGGSRDKKEAAIMKAEGITAGVSDLILNVPAGPYTQLAVEMKSPKGTLSDEQKRYSRYAQAVGIKYIVCRDFGTFCIEVQEYLEAVNPLILEQLRQLRKEDREAEVLEARRTYLNRCTGIRNTSENKTYKRNTP